MRAARYALAAALWLIVLPSMLMVMM